jgi:hypothetical protein
MLRAAHAAVSSAAMKLLASLVSVALLSTFALAGCAVDSTGIDGAASADDADDVVAAGSADELSARARGYVGIYSSRIQTRDFMKLNLKGDGTFAADTYFQVVVPGSKIACLNGNCTMPETGTWSVRRVSGNDVLTINPATGATRKYTVAQASDGGPTLFSRAGNAFQLGRKVASCAAVKCANGQRCIIGDSGPACSPSCQVIRCSAGSECVDAPDQPSRCVEVLHPACAFTSCPRDYNCVQDPRNAQSATCTPSCALIDCLPGKSCKDTAKGAICQ